MQGGTFITAGSTRTYDDDRFASAPRGILFDSNALKALKPHKPFDCTRNGAPLALWLEHVDKAIYANPSVSIPLSYLPSVAGFQTASPQGAQ